MKFIHTADIHLGACPDRNTPWGENREKEIWDTFKRLIEVVKTEKPDMFLIAGDLFHRQPKVSELKEVDYLFSTLSPTKVVMIAGNHDPITETSHYKDYKWSDNVFFLSSSKMEIFSFDDINVDVYGFSYHEKMIKDNIYDYIRPQNKNRINILLAHGGDDQHIPMNQNLILLNGFEYVACGHIHIPFLHKNASLAYSGSLEPIDKNDKGVRGYILGEISKTERFITLVPFAKRNYFDLDIDVASGMSCSEVYDMINAKIKEAGADNIYHIFIRGFRDPDIEFNKVDISLLGNIISVTDESEPDYDFEELYNNNKDNMIGIYISKFGDRSALNEIQKKALYYGTKALLDTDK